MYKVFKIKFSISKAKRAIALFAFIFYTLFFCGQTINNLVPNHSFEDTIKCPNNISKLDFAKLWYRVDYNSTPDLYSSCSSTTINNIPSNTVGFQNPRTGNNMAGFILYSSNFEGRENIGIGLSNKLLSNKIYCVTFYVSLAERSRIAISNLGVYFNNDSAKSFYPVPSPPTLTTFSTPVIENPNSSMLIDTINWTKIQGQYTANGSELHIGIGNFRNDLNTNLLAIKPLPPFFQDNFSYYYIDDISVVEINPAKASVKDTILVCANATYTLGTDSTWDASYQWQPTTGLSCTNCPNPILTVTNNIKYVLTKQQCSATTKDSVVFKIYNTPVTILPLSNATICVGNTTTLSVDSNSFFNYNWQPNIGLSCNNCALPIASPLTPVTYTLTKSACGFSNTANVTVHIKPNFTLTPQITLTNTISCLYDTLKFKIINVPVANDINYNWQPQNTFISILTNTTKALIQNNSYYFVTISNSNNGNFCPFVKKDSIYISIADTCLKPLVIPNIFTPNYDGVNDVWKFTMPYGTTLNAVYVYNRWGALIYSVDELILNSDNSKIKTVYWDGHTTSGEECADGIYFYLVSVTENGEKKTFKGNITLIR